MDKRYNVLWMTSWYPDAFDPIAGIFVREHARATSLFDNITVLHLMERQTKVKKLWNLEKEESHELNLGIPTYHLRAKQSPLPFTTLFIFMLGAFQSIARLRKQGLRMDLIHAHIYRAGFPAAFAARWFRIPLVISEQNSIFPSRKLLGAEKFKACIAFKQANIVLPVSSFLKRSIQAYGFKPNFKVIGNTFDPDIFYFSQNKTPGDVFQIITVASLSPNKRIEVLIKALAGLPENIPSWKLRIIGKGPEEEALRMLSSQSGIQNQVEFIGALTKSRVAEELRQADFFVLPSLYETFSVATLEALACGLPVLVTKSGGPEEFVTDNTGILFPPDDIDALRKGLIYMLNHSREYSGEEIASKVREHYSLKSVGLQIHKIYDSLLE